MGIGLSERGMTMFKKGDTVIATRNSEFHGWCRYEKGYKCVLRSDSYMICGEEYITTIDGKQYLAANFELFNRTEKKS